MTGDTGAIQEGRAARVLGLTMTRNPYRQYLQSDKGRAESDSLRARTIELANCWDSGWARQGWGNRHG